MSIRIMLQRARELDPAPRHVGMGRLGGQCGVGRDDVGGFCNHLAVGQHEPGLDRRPRPRPAFEQPALNQQHVRARLRGAGSPRLFFMGLTPICARAAVGCEANAELE